MEETRQAGGGSSIRRDQTHFTLSFPCSRKKSLDLPFLDSPRNKHFDGVSNPVDCFRLPITLTVASVCSRALAT